MSSDAGGLLLREFEKKWRLIGGLCECFSDLRDQRFVEHELEGLLRQRVFGLALGYEDLNDHKRLRLDPLLAVLAEKEDPLGMDRLMEEDRGKALASASTLNRLEISNEKAGSRYHKIWMRFEAQNLYEKFYCMRGDMENRIKEQQLDLFADRTSTHYLQSNQLRLWFSTFAYMIIERMRAEVLQGTELARATAGTIRLKLFKVAGSIEVTVAAGACAPGLGLSLSGTVCYGPFTVTGRARVARPRSPLKRTGSTRRPTRSTEDCLCMERNKRPLAHKRPKNLDKITTSNQRTRRRVPNEVLTLSILAGISPAVKHPG